MMCVQKHDAFVHCHISFVADLILTFWNINTSYYYHHLVTSWFKSIRIFTIKMLNIRYAVTTYWCYTNIFDTDFVLPNHPVYRCKMFKSYILLDDILFITYNYIEEMKSYYYV